MTRLQQILESKAAYRRQLARRPIAEKLRIVEELAERTLAIRKKRAPGNQIKTEP
ncbi:hypothetical protein [Verrucomicrobium sp. BvORR034]|jgi:hypothetical protein|uniref:hypothetical protein n=1 Tax=Verrucomicrobium sp. BvORR034 TaxID=1396418 RepID=UPI000A4C3C80|nr:hypothetical protein [Verrucomicrobium sp. BvORR034]